MGLFGTKDPMAKWRRRNSAMAELADRTGWQVDLTLGIVNTVVRGTPVTVILSPPAGVGLPSTTVLIGAGRQAEATMDNRVEDIVDGRSFAVHGWEGTSAPGSGLIEGHFSGPDRELVDAVVVAVEALVARVKAT